MSPEEFRSCMEDKLREYYRVLGDSVLEGKNKEFWDYHKKRLSECGLTLDRGRLARALISLGMNALLNPKRTIEKLLNGDSVLSGRFRAVPTHQPSRHTT